MLAFVAGHVILVPPFPSTKQVLTLLLCQISIISCKCFNFIVIVFMCYVHDLSAITMQTKHICDLFYVCHFCLKQCSGLGEVKKD